LREVEPPGPATVIVHPPGALGVSRHATVVPNAGSPDRFTPSAVIATAVPPVVRQTSVVRNGVGGAHGDPTPAVAENDTMTGGAGGTVVVVGATVVVVGATVVGAGGGGAGDTVVPGAAGGGGAVDAGAPAVVVGGSGSGITGAEVVDDVPGT
jgi:hypothetical protein